MIFFQDSLIFQDKQNSEFWLRSAPADNNTHGLDVHFFSYDTLEISLKIALCEMGLYRSYIRQIFCSLYA